MSPDDLKAGDQCPKCKKGKLYDDVIGSEDALCCPGCPAFYVKECRFVYAGMTR